jgi:hypothetical protein
MDTHRCICVRVRDLDIVKESPRLVELPAPSETDYNVLTTEFEGKPGYIVGPEKRHVRFVDSMVGARLDRDAVSNNHDPANAALIASYTFDAWLAAHITHITRQTTKLHNIGVGTTSGSPAADGLTQFEHWLRFHTDENVPEGTEIFISPPNGEFPDVEWTFNARNTWSPAIHFNCHGISPYDPVKSFTLDIWLPYFQNHGVVDFTDFGVPLRAKAIHDDTGEDDSDWFPITLRKAEDSVSPGDSALRRIASTTQQWPILAINLTTPLSFVIDTTLQGPPSIGDFISGHYIKGPNNLNSQPSSILAPVFLPEQTFAAPGHEVRFAEVTGVTETDTNEYEVEIGSLDGTDTTIGINLSAQIVIGSTITGVTSGATAVARTTSNASGFQSLVFGTVVGTFQASEFLEVESSTVGQITGTIVARYAAYTGEGHLFGCVELNRSGTKVYECDISKWAPSVLNKKYRFLVDGLGTNLPFLVDPSVWAQAARVLMGGYYNTYNGVELLGEYGYTRPKNFTNAVTRAAHQVGAGEGNDVVSYETEDVLDIPPGGIQDAGDLDQLSYHMTQTVRLLLAREFVDDDTWALPLGHPGALTLFQRNDWTAAISYWAGTESLGGIIQNAIWICQFWRTMRKAGGEVRGVWGYTNKAAGLALHYHPTWLDDWDLWAHEADVVATFRFASLASMLGRLLKLEGLTDLGNTLIAEAEESFDQALVIQADPDTYYAGGIATIDPSRYASIKDAITDSGRGAEAVAAVLLWWAAGTENDYLAITEDISFFQTFGNTDRDLVAFIYTLVDDPEKANLVNPALFVSQGAAGRFTTDADQGHYGMSGSGTPEFGRGMPDESIEMLMRGLYHNALGAVPEKDYYKVLWRAAAHVLGAGPQNLSFVQGIGERWARNVLNEDTGRHLGIPTTPGMIAFGYMTPPSWSPNFMWGAGTEFYAALAMPRNLFSGVNATKMPEPPPQHLPIEQFFMEQDRIIPMMEAQPIAISYRALYWALPLHDKYGKGQTTAGARIRLGTASWGAAP